MELNFKLMLSLRSLFGVELNYSAFANVYNANIIHLQLMFRDLCLLKLNDGWLASYLGRTKVFLLILDSAGHVVFLTALSVPPRIKPPHPPPLNFLGYRLSDLQVL